MRRSGTLVLTTFVGFLCILSLLPQPCIKTIEEEVKSQSTAFQSIAVFNPSLESASRHIRNSTTPSYGSVLNSSGKSTNTSYNTNRNSDVALQAQLDNGYPLEPVSQVLPQRLFLIYGCESSGTTFTAKAVAKALGIDTEKNKGDFINTDDGKDHVQHISLPWGMVRRQDWGFSTQYTEPLPMIPVFYPKPCQMNPPKIGGEKPPSLKAPPVECQPFMGKEVMTRPFRFFVNMTTNIEWYRERGVRVYPIMVVRDPLMHFQGITKKNGGHAPNGVAAYQQYETCRTIMTETIERGINPILISYETMLTLQVPYLKQLFIQLGIGTNVYPKFRNGNTKYLDQPHPFVETELMKEDGVVPSSKRVSPRAATLGLMKRHGDLGTTRRYPTSRNRQGASSRPLHNRAELQAMVKQATGEKTLRTDAKLHPTLTHYHSRIANGVGNVRRE